MLRYIRNLFRKDKYISIVRGSYEISIEDYDNFIYQWNLRNPIDRWWREKHNISFNSPEHRVSCFIDMYMEWREDKIYIDLLKDEDKYDFNKHNYLKEQEFDVSNEQLMEFFSK